MEAFTAARPRNLSVLYFPGGWAAQRPVPHHTTRQFSDAIEVVTDEE